MKAITDSLPIENSMDLILILLYSPGKNRVEGQEPIEGITRLQKLIFLLKQSKDQSTELTALVAIAKDINYEAYKMGPYSSQIQNEINILLSAGLISTIRLNYLLTDDNYDTSLAENSTDYADNHTRKVESMRYSLTTRGIEVGQKLWNTLSDEQKKALIKFKEFFNSISLRQLLIFVYEKYPEFTTKSEIKKYLGLN